MKTLGNTNKLDVERGTGQFPGGEVIEWATARQGGRVEPPGSEARHLGTSCQEQQLGASSWLPGWTGGYSEWTGSGSPTSLSMGGSFTFVLLSFHN